ncbi:MAG: SDR family NAD(P)-dependent oxidoreductase [Anaerolineae bacterium]|nr:SDR family NAD(P)-dependent oxidoreductase [Anaerolineae bacterium]MDQ7035599.1 SDR family NAD(P)-dependent oxidoreductase [Anaerolineae bacterium]
MQRGEAMAIAADVTKDGDIEELIGQTVDTYGGIDVLVNNAGYTWGRGCWRIGVFRQ